MLFRTLPNKLWGGPKLCKVSPSTLSNAKLEMMASAAVGRSLLRLPVVGDGLVDGPEELFQTNSSGVWWPHGVGTFLPCPVACVLMPENRIGRLELCCWFQQS